MIRLWINATLNSDVIKLDQKQKHYLFNVMRQKIGNEILVFGLDNTEWTGELAPDHIRLLGQTRKMETGPLISLAIGCIKKPRLELLVEKATEVGVHEIFLLHTNYSQRISYNFDRLNAIAIEASEQSYRLDVPKIHPPCNLEDFLVRDNGYKLILCSQYAEKGALENIKNGNTCVLVGPEGGWSPHEEEIMSHLHKIKLSQNILRAETAAVVGIALLQRVYPLQGDDNSGEA